MESTSEVAWESNEAEWWAGWADMEWVARYAYVILSSKFREPFFNRGGFIVIRRGAEKSIQLMEAVFEKHGLKPRVFVQSVEKRPRLLKFLSDRGYQIADQMSVMELWCSTFTSNAKVSVERVGESRIEDWASAYLISFYGRLDLLPVVKGIVERVVALKEATLLLATVRGELAGGLAMYRSDGVCGIYCVGTCPTFRGGHIASTLLEHACRIAAEEGKKVILQTILSDSTEPFYLKVGFRRAYLKELFVKKRELKS